MDAVAKSPPWYVRFVFGRNPLYTLFRALIWATLLLVIFKYVFVGIRVRGESMEPAYHDGEIKLINRIAYLRHPPERGDVVAIRAPELNAVILKRVIALPGERLLIRGRGEVYINGKKLEEPYTKGKTSFKGSTELEPNQYWLIGDNRDISENYFAYDYKILGKVLFQKK